MRQRPGVRPPAGRRADVTVETGPQRLTVCELDSQDGMCESCRQPIWWVVTPRGRYMPVNPPGRSAESLHGVPLLSHFATCPFATHYRRRRR